MVQDVSPQLCFQLQSACLLPHFPATKDSYLQELQEQKASNPYLLEDALVMVFHYSGRKVNTLRCSPIIYELIGNTFFPDKTEVLGHHD